MIAVLETWLVPSMSLFVSIDRFKIIHSDDSPSVRKHVCCLYVGDSMSLVQSDVDMLNVAA